MEFFFAILFSLFSIVDPPGAIPVYVALTAGRPRPERNKIALMTSLYFLLILVSFFLAGTYILSFFGLTVHSLRIAGGMTLQTTFSQPVWHKKGAVTLVVVNPFRHDVVYGTTLEGPGFSQSKNTYVPFRMVSVGFSYRFGKAGALNQMTKKKSVKNTDVKEAEKEQL